MKKKINDPFRYGYIYDLVWKKKYPIHGIRRNYSVAYLRRGADKKIYGFGMKEKDWKALCRNEHSQPYEIYWNVNEVRKDLNLNKWILMKRGKPFEILPEERAITRGFVKIKGANIHLKTLERTGKKMWTVSVDQLNNFDVFKAVKKAKYKKRYMS